MAETEQAVQPVADNSIDSMLKAAQDRGVEIPSGALTEPVVTPEVKKDESVKKEVTTEEERAIMHPKLAAFSKRDSALRKKEKELAEREKKIKELEQPKRKRTPKEIISEEGFTYEDIINDLLGTQGNKQEGNELVARLKALEEDRAKEKAAAEQRAKEEETKKIQEGAKAYADSLRNFIKENAIKYELITNSENEQLVLDTLIEYYNQSGEELAWDQAADMVEEYLEKELSEKVAKLTKLEKIKKKLEPASVGKEEPAKKEQIEDIRPEPTTKTLSNTKTASQVQDNTSGPLDDEERLKQAIALANELMR